MTSLDLTFSHSQISLWNDCRLKWYFKYVLGFTEREKSEALRLGTAAHEFLANHYRGAQEIGFANERALIENHLNFAQARSQDITDVSDLQVVSQTAPLIQRYIEDYSMYKDKKYEILKIEEHYTLPVELPSGREVNFQLYLDLLVRDIESGHVWIWDHKTHKSRPWSKSKVMMDPQLPAYTVILREHGIDVFGMIYNLVNVYDYKKPAPPEKLFQREETYRTPIEIESAYVEMKKAMDDILDNWENPRRSQDAEKCSRCWFQDPCLMLMKGFPVDEAFDESVYEQSEVNAYYEEAAS